MYRIALTLLAALLLAFGTLACGDSSGGGSGSAFDNIGNDGANDGNDGNDGNGGNDGNDGNGVSEVQICVDSCDDVSQCPNATDYVCAEGACIYTGEAHEPEVCHSNGDCVARMSGWVDYDTGELLECGGDSDCDDMAGQVCAEYEGQGYCVTDGSALNCSDFGLDTIHLDLTDEAGQVEVCANTATECHAEGYCTMCIDNADCADFADFGMDTCLASGLCGCGGDSSCDPVDNADSCYDGTCGCSGDEVCDGDDVCASFSI